MKSKKKRNLTILALVLVAIVGAYYFSGNTQSVLTNPDATGSFTLTSNGEGIYTATLLGIDDTGRSINFYFQHTSGANLFSNPTEINIDTTNLAVQTNSMFLQTTSGCIKQPVYAIGSLDKTQLSDGRYVYSFSMARGFSCTNYCCGGPCQSDCDSNIGQTTAGFITFKDLNYQSCIPQDTCGAWGDCTANIQTRECSDGCGNTTTETQACQNQCRANTEAPCTTAEWNINTCSWDSSTCAPPQPDLTIVYAAIAVLALAGAAIFLIRKVR